MFREPEGNTSATLATFLNSKLSHYLIGAFLYVVTHLRKIERMIASDNLVPARRGPRNNMVLIICAVPIVVTTLLLFLIFKA